MQLLVEVSAVVTTSSENRKARASANKRVYKSKKYCHSISIVGFKIISEYVG